MDEKNDRGKTDFDQTKNKKINDNNFLKSLISGGIAGTTVDLIFYPLDTIKTRLQSSRGFLKSGGFNGIYKGLGSVAVGSSPSAALFFMTYEGCKRNFLPKIFPSLSNPQIHMISASIGEIAACLIRVPIEVIKQRQQVSAYGLGTSSMSALRLTIRNGGIGSLYQGFGITIAREVPFALIQFPLYESLKQYACSKYDFRSTDQLPFYISAISGSIAGSIAGSLTTPLDVIKTRIMLSTNQKSQRMNGSGNGLGRRFDKDLSSIKVYKDLIVGIYRVEGFRTFWKGIVPRTVWIGFGGAVFLGVYDFAHQHL